MEGELQSLGTAGTPQLERYRYHLAHLGLPQEREDEIMSSVWRIMSSFVDRAFGDDPVQHLGRAVDDFVATPETSRKDVISSAEINADDNRSNLSRAFTSPADRLKEDS